MKTRIKMVICHYPNNTTTVLYTPQYRYWGLWKNISKLSPMIYIEELDQMIYTEGESFIDIFSTIEEAQEVLDDFIRIEEQKEHRIWMKKNKKVSVSYLYDGDY